MTDVNWDLIQDLAKKPHRNINIVEGEQYGLMVDGVFDNCCNGVNEVMFETRAVHHLCDLAGIPVGEGYASDVDARVFLLLRAVNDLRDRMARIGSWHSRETTDGGMVGDFCNECGHTWPCDTSRMADGTYVDGESEIR